MRGAAGFKLPGCSARTSTVPGGPGGVIPGLFYRPGGRGQGRCGFEEFLARFEYVSLIAPRWIC